jgi:carbon-monoxide dehydrogenase small subunit
MNIEFTLNGSSVNVDVPANTTLLTLLRDHLGLTGTKNGCEIGECGACSTLVNGRVVNACLLLAPQVGGCEVVTIEGVHAPGGGPNDLQQAFLEFGATQCGFCIPGLVLAAEALLERDLNPSRDTIRDAISGNLCRCNGYQQVVDLIEVTAQRRRIAARHEENTP